jgi:hypothetical protein
MAAVPVDVKQSLVAMGEEASCPSSLARVEEGIGESPQTTSYEATTRYAGDPWPRIGARMASFGLMLQELQV